MIFLEKKLKKPLLKYSSLGFDREIIEVNSNWSKADSYWNQEMKEKNMDEDN